MKGLTYTITNNNKHYSDLHLNRGYAYETNTHFVHQYGVNIGLQTISIGLTAIEKKEGSLGDWIVKRFGATDVQEMKTDIGFVVKNVWRPTLMYSDDLSQALSYSDIEKHAAEQSLRLLLNKLDELFLYIEPSQQCMSTYSYKTRELLILACTEVEDIWKTFMDTAGLNPMNKRYTTKDYVKLVDKLHLREYQFTLKVNETPLKFRPFANWCSKDPTGSIEWYEAYNKTKHNKTLHFSQATLKRCIEAVVANLAMHCVRYGANPMVSDSNIFSNLVQQHFNVELIDCNHDTFYLHSISIPDNARTDFFIFNPLNSHWAEPFKEEPLIL